MTQHIIPTIVYRQIISLIIHYITIPVGSEVYIHLVDCALQQSGKFQENYVMALEASDWLIDII